MFSVTDVVEQLRQAHALTGVAREAAMRAEMLISEGGEIFNDVTRTSVWPQVEQIRWLGRDAGDDVRAAYAELVRAQEIIDGYCVSIAGYGVAGLDGQGTIGTEPVPAAEDGRGGAADHGERESEWIAERERAGVVINPKDVTRIRRLPDGRIVWTEKDNRRGGQDHILGSKRVGEFGAMGVDEDRIMDLVFAALERGLVVGYSGVDRPVYEVVFEGERQRLAITVTRDGLIVGANPISLKRKLRPRMHKRN